MDEFRVGIIGCGRPWKSDGATGFGMSHCHALGYAQSPYARIVALADLVPENAEAFQQIHGGDTIYTDYHEMLAKENLDIVSICTWPHLHAQMVIAAAEAGVKAIHCEKPMAPTWGEARRMAEACATHNVQLTFNHQRRFAPEFRQARDLLRAGAIGGLVRLEGACGNLFDWGTHWFDMMLGFNDQNPVEWAMGQVDWRGAMAIFGVPIERFGMAHFACQNGVRGTLVGGRGDEVENGVRVRLSGSKGQIEIGQQRGGQHQLRLLNEANGWQILPVPGEDTGDDPYPRVMADLVHCLENGATSILSARNALQATELIFGAYESARLGERVSLPLQGVSSHPLLSILREHDALPENTLIN